MTEYVYLYNAS